MLIKRVLSALVILPLFVAALLFLTSAHWSLFLLLILLMGAWEWATLAHWPLWAIGLYVLGTAACGLWIQWFNGASPSIDVFTPTLLVSLFFWFVVAPLWLKKGWTRVHPLLLALTGWVVLLPLWLSLVRLQSHPLLLLAIAAVIWISDTAAYGCGKRWGKRKLAAHISPGKTWEGFLGAMVAISVYYGVLYVVYASVWPPMSFGMGLGVVVLMGILGVEGDLFESWIKRVAGVKDSGFILPGHGGLLDRIDALCPSMPLAALIFSSYY